MKSTVMILIVTLLLFYVHIGSAYEPGTHLKLSEQAAQQSVLGNPSEVLADLDLKSIGDKTQQFSNAQEGEMITLGPNGSDPLIARASDTILGLIGTGAALEDEFPRSLFHFYDPVPGHLDPLSISGVLVPYSAPDWALAGPLLPAAI